MKLLHLILLGIFLTQACSQTISSKEVNKRDTIQNNFSYTIQPVESYELPNILDEISGITFISNDDENIYAVQDEVGKVFKYNLSTKKIVNELHFGKAADYEDITNDGQHFYILKSNGTIYQFPVNFNEQTAPKEYKLLPKGEYESMAFKPSDRSLYVLCKECAVDKGKGTVTGYILSLNNNNDVEYTSSFEISLAKLKILYSKIGKRIKPSAMTYNPISKQWFIISSIDKIIFSTNEDFVPLAVVNFERSQYEQPEGLAFDSNQQLYISSELGSTDHAMLYKLKR